MEVINTIGRRKNAVARIYLKSGKGNITVNDKDYTEYFKTPQTQYYAVQPFELTNNDGKFDLVVNTSGGGYHGQAEALRLGLSRALVKLDEENKTILKAAGLLTRDSREVERKKPGQPKARKKFQFSKR